MTTRNDDGAAISPELKKGSLDLLVLSLLALSPRHGYEISRLIQVRSGGQLQCRITTLYPVLYRLENHGWIQGRWVERPGERRRRTYSLTDEGQQILAQQREQWRVFAGAVNQVLDGCDA